MLERGQSQLSFTVPEGMKELTKRKERVANSGLEREKGGGEGGDERNEIQQGIRQRIYEEQRRSTFGWWTDAKERRARGCRRAATANNPTTHPRKLGGTEARAAVKPVVVAQLIDLDALLVLMRHRLRHHQGLGIVPRDELVAVAHQVGREVEMLLQGQLRRLGMVEDGERRHGAER